MAAVTSHHSQHGFRDVTWYVILAFQLLFSEYVASFLGQFRSHRTVNCFLERIRPWKCDVQPHRTRSQGKQTNTNHFVEMRREEFRPSPRDEVKGLEHKSAQVPPRSAPVHLQISLRCRHYPKTWDLVAKSAGKRTDKSEPSHQFPLTWRLGALLTWNWTIPVDWATTPIANLRETRLKFTSSTWKHQHTSLVDLHTLRHGPSLKPNRGDRTGTVQCQLLEN